MFQGDVSPLSSRAVLESCVIIKCPRHHANAVTIMALEARDGLIGPDSGMQFCTWNGTQSKASSC